MNRILPLLLLILGIPAWLLARSFGTRPLFDPDRFYHLGLSKMISDHPGILRELPQFEGLGWDKNFIDKEFLFHQLTALAYRIAGEAGVAAIPPLVTTLILATLGWIIWSRSKSAALSALIPLLGTLLIPSYFDRLIYVRPHLLAILWIVLLVGGILQRKKWIAAFASCLFLLSYHAFPIPLLILSLTALFGIFLDRSFLKISLYGFIGSTLGVLLNPYFPGNVIMGWITAKIALAPHLQAVVPIGQELIPKSGPELMSRYGVLLVTLLISFFVLGKSRSKTTERAQNDFSFLCILSALFWALTFKSPRAAEYALPIHLLLCADLLTIGLGSLHWPKNRTLIACSLILALLTVQAWPIYRTQLAQAKDVDPRAARIFQALEKLPPPQSQKVIRVFNAEWFTGPYLFFARPDLRAFDALDPELLMTYSPPAYKIHEAIHSDLIPDVSLALRSVFKSDYVLTTHQIIAARLERDPDFRRLYPAAWTSQENAPFLYEIVSSDAAPWIKNTLEQPTHTSECARRSVSKSDIELYKSSTLLGVGGGPETKVLFNGQFLYSSSGATFPARRVEALIPLPHPLTDKDQIEIIRCSQNPPVGTLPAPSLSLWTQPKLEQFCARKSPDGQAQIDRLRAAQATYQSQPMSTCLGPIASTVRFK